MIARRLNILNFKNLKSVDLELSQSLNCFVGSNGAGKTNILDALFYLSMTKSAFGLTDLQCVRRGDDFFMIAADYGDNPEILTKVVSSFKERKVLKKDGKEYEKLKDHIGLLPIVFSSPSDVVLISESPEERRKFMNSSISQMDTEYLNALVGYNKLITERNKALKGGSAFLSYIDILDERIPDIASLIFRTRRDYITSLSPEVSRIYTEISGHKEEVSIAYESDLQHTSASDLLKQNREKDKIMGYTTSGIHRDDLRLTISGVPIKKFGSQGQQKTMLLALKLAQALIYNETKKCKTILLLDDVFDKLDTDRVENLIRFVSDMDLGQIFITDSSQLRLENTLNSTGKEYNLFRVENGEVTRL